MKPTTFNEQTKVLTKPFNMTDIECGTLPVYSDGNQCISCWGLNFIERVKLLVFGKIWLQVLFNGNQPPVKLTINYPFIKEPAND